MIPIIQNALLWVEVHAALTQAVSAIVTMVIAAVALVYAIKSLRALQRQVEASVALTTETFRPIIEIQGGSFGATSQIDFVNKGNGAALNFRWTVDETPERWRPYTSNIIAPQERGVLRGEIEWKKGLILSYNSVAHREEIRTQVTFGPTGSVFNSHDAKRGAAVTRQGWTLIDPDLAVPAFHPDFIRSMSRIAQIKHWWRLKRGKERRL